MLCQHRPHHQGQPHGGRPSMPPGTRLHVGVVCGQLHGRCDDLAAIVLVDQACVDSSGHRQVGRPACPLAQPLHLHTKAQARTCARQLGVEAVAKHLLKAALVVVVPLLLCGSSTQARARGAHRQGVPAGVLRLGPSPLPAHPPGSYTPPTSTTTSSVFSTSGSRVRTTSAPTNFWVCSSRAQPSASSAWNDPLWVPIVTPIFCRLGSAAAAMQRTGAPARGRSGCWASWQ